MTPAGRASTGAGGGRRRAFTLVELLAVLGVIGMVAAVVVPAALQAMGRARSGQCQEQMRQWGVAFALYADEHEGALPRRGQGVQPLRQIDRAEDWFNALPGYIGSAAYGELIARDARPAERSRSVFICPAAVDPRSTYFLPYGMNMNLSPWNLPRATKFGEVAQPDHVVALADAPGPYSSTYPSARAYSILARHLSCVNLLMLAGAVRALEGAQAGCGRGDPQLPDVRWLTGTESDSQASAY